ncbi:MAG TPA: leucyl aminopeptidase [Trueperaceae bacterium]|nr:leucyl aminopeptidase [Trueperaceae bacterium]
MDVATSVVAADVTSLTTDALVIGLHDDGGELAGAARASDKATGGAISELLAGGDFTGKPGATAVIYPRGSLGARRVVLVGLGASQHYGLEVVRRAAAEATSRAAALGATSVAMTLHQSPVPGKSAADVAQATVEGSMLASYRFEATLRRARQKSSIDTLVLVADDRATLHEVEAGAGRGAVVARAVWAARDLVNQPPNVANPAYLAAHARHLAQRYGLALHVGDKVWAAEHQMGAFLAVTQGSRNEPAFIVLEHNAGRLDLPTLVLVGKGVTFDTGGLSLKTKDGMIPMKGDMGGAAAVLGAMQAIAELAVPVHLVAICPCVENMPDGAAYRPSDVIVASNGVSIEIHSTDAEGRMVLADALVYAGRYSPAAVVDIATLTGASVAALGAGVSASLFASSEEVAAQLSAASDNCGERVWRMPLFDEYRDTIDAKVAADLKNSGGARGGVGTSAVFLQAFTDYPWAHVDMAGMELVDAPGKKPYLTAGATGFGVRLLVEFVANRVS